MATAVQDTTCEKIALGSDITGDIREATRTGDIHQSVRFRFGTKKF